MKTILWWGRFDPDYSRNRILRSLQQELGYRVVDFHPRYSFSANLEANIRGIDKPDVIWVPCFRQRDVKAASRWARAQQIPLVFDPLISAWDKQVLERKKFAADSNKAHKLLRKETGQFHVADRIIADSEEHARFFGEKFEIETQRISVIPVGAEEKIFKPAPLLTTEKNTTEILFYGSFINLQAPTVIIEAARLCDNPAIHWHLLGSGPLLDECKQLAKNINQVAFEDWIDYQQLPARIHKADILLGIFGSSQKAARVIPNKVYQAMACARPVITRRSPAYPAGLQNGQQSGIYLIPENDPMALCEAARKLCEHRELIVSAGKNARNTYELYFSTSTIKNKLKEVLSELTPNQ